MSPMGLTNSTPLAPRVGDGQIFKFLTSSQRGQKRAPMISEPVRDTDVLFPPWEAGIARNYHTSVSCALFARESS